MILDITIKEASPQTPLAPPQEITIPSSEQSTFPPLLLHHGEEVIITVENPNNEFHNGNIGNGNWDEDKAIHCEMQVDKYNTYEDWWYDRRPLEAVSFNNQNPLSFRYKAIRTGAVRLNVSKGPPTDRSGL